MADHDLTGVAEVDQASRRPLGSPREREPEQGVEPLLAQTLGDGQGDQSRLFDPRKQLDVEPEGIHQARVGTRRLVDADLEARLAPEPEEGSAGGEGFGGSDGFTFGMVCPAARIREFTFSSSSDAV